MSKVGGQRNTTVHVLHTTSKQSTADECQAFVVEHKKYTRKYKVKSK